MRIRTHKRHSLNRNEHNNIKNPSFYYGLQSPLPAEPSNQNPALDIINYTVTDLVRRNVTQGGMNPDQKLQETTDPHEMRTLLRPYCLQVSTSTIQISYSNPEETNSEIPEPVGTVPVLIL